MKHLLLDARRTLGVSALPLILLAACAAEQTTTIDADGDGVADDLGKTVDANGDGVPDWVDNTGDGIPDVIGVDTNGDFIIDAGGYDTDGDGIIDALDRDLNGSIDGGTSLGGSGGTTGSGGGTQGSGGGVFGSGGGVGVGGGLTGSGGGLGATGGSFNGGGGVFGSGGGVGVGGVVNGTGGGLPGSGGGGQTVACTITATATPAADIPTVGVVEITTDAQGVTGGTIDFGADTSYGMAAPIDPAAPSYKTLLLGMASGSTYHYRVSVETPSGVCVGPDQEFQTGGLPAGGPSNLQPQAGSSSSPVAPGFIVASYGIGSGGTWGFIYNKQGQVVWSYNFPGASGFNNGTVRALMSWDGKYMYARDLGPFDAASGGTIYRVNMDGTGAMTLPTSGGSHHDFTVTPDGIAYIAKPQAGECDHIMTAGPDGSGAASLIDLWDVLQFFPDKGGSGEKCHVNAIRYSSEGDYFTVSDREKDVIAKISSTGQVLAAFGQNPSGTVPSFAAAEGSGTTWRVQHGHHLYAEDKLLVFSNGAFGGGTSRMLHYTINGANASLDWEYTEMGNSSTLGDVQALPNGNFLVSQSQGGNMDEVDASAQRVQRLKFQSLGYAEHRTSLYGAPDR